MNMSKSLLFAAPIFAALSLAVAQTENEFIKPSFTVFHEMGRIQDATFDNTLPLDNAWMHRSGAWVNLKGQRGERLSLDLLIGGTYWTATKEQSDPNTKARFFAASVPRLDVTYKFGDVEDPFLKLNGGIFNYKYNEHSKNLGEYAFRSGTYPGWVSTGGLTFVGTAGAQITGFKLSQSVGAFSHDLLASLETEVIPTYDLTLTYMAKYNWNNVVKVGGGVQLARIMPAVPSRTNPNRIADANHPSGYNPNVSNRYFKHDGEWFLDWPEYYLNLMSHPSTTGADSARYIRAMAVLDSARGRDIGGTPLDGGAGAPLINVSYENYKASGVKPIATLAFDPKPLLGGLSMLSKNDLVVYGEAALLGVKDYPIFYDDWTKRLPVMVGFNFPTFKLLDVLSLEVEHYGSQYPDNYFMLMSGGVQGMPWPTITESGGFSKSDWAGDDWKWSVFAQRTLVDGVSMSLQVARDHSRAWAFPTGKTHWGIFNKDEGYYWMLRLTANI
jgi:hypothetical protein